MPWRKPPFGIATATQGLQGAGGCDTHADVHIFGGSKAGAGAAPKGSSTIAYITEREFEKSVLLSEIPVLVEFTADWCQPCHAIAPEVEAFAQEMAGKLTVYKVDADKSQILAKQLRVQSLPTFLLFVDQRLGDVQVGALGRKQLRAMVEPHLPRDARAVAPLELAQLMREGVVVPVDVRDASAFGRAHIPGALNLPFDELENRLAELFMVQGQPVLYDRAGEKTKDLSAAWAKQGNEVAFLEGGFLRWESEALPVNRP